MPPYEDILANIAATMPPIYHLVVHAASLIGLVFAIKALLALKAGVDSGKAGGGGKEPLVYLAIATMLIYFPSGFNAIMVTAFGTSDITPLSLPAKTWGISGEAFTSLTIIIQTIGLVSFVRGWVLIAKSASTGQPPGGMGKGFVHVFGGVLAVNIVGTIQVLSNTLYGTS